LDYNKEQIKSWTEGCLLPFSKKGDMGLANNYKGITLTSIAAKVYYSLLLNIQPEIKNTLQIKTALEKKSNSCQILTVSRLIEDVKAKILQLCLL